MICRDYPVEDDQSLYAFVIREHDHIHTLRHYRSVDLEGPGPAEGLSDPFHRTGVALRGLGDPFPGPPDVIGECFVAGDGFRNPGGLEASILTECFCDEGTDVRLVGGLICALVGDHCGVHRKNRTREGVPYAGREQSRSMEKTKHRIYGMPFARVYPLYVTKAERKGRTKEEVDQIITWLTGYGPTELASQIDRQVDLETFLDEAPQLNPARAQITGVVCGVRIEEIEEPTMREIRYMDKLIDELAKGRPMEKILRS